MKRQFFAIILLLISFCFVFSTKSFAFLCCSDVAHSSPTSNEMCGSQAGPYQNSCVGTDTPFCDILSNTCVAEPPTTPTPTPTLAVCGNLNQNCCAPPATGPSIPRNYCNDDTLQCLGQTFYYPYASGKCEPLSSTPTPSPTDYINPVSIKDMFCIPGKRDSGIMTALGCIKTSGPNGLITSILKIATSVGGGIALALILYGVFIVTTSAGMPDKLKAGSEIITSAIIGLIFILLSVFLINLIGINILGIPGLSNTPIP